MLTKAEVNKALALLNEWHNHGGEYWWHKPNKKLNDRSFGPPDYCGKWKYLGPLFEKMVEAGSVELSLRGGLFFVISSVLQENRSSSDESTGDTLTEACAREVLAWQENNISKWDEKKAKAYLESAPGFNHPSSVFLSAAIEKIERLQKENAKLCKTNQGILDAYDLRKACREALRIGEQNDKERRSIPSSD